MLRSVIASVCFFVVSTFAFAKRTAPKTVPIVTIDGERVFVSEKVLKETYELHLGVRPPEIVLPRMTAQERLALEREIYAWAYSNSGLGLGRDEALAFSEELAQNAYGPEGFKILKTVYDYAYNNAGLGLGRTESRLLAKSFVAQPRAPELFETYKTAYEYAYSNQGLGMSRDKAREYAARKSGLTK